MELSSIYCTIHDTVDERNDCIIDMYTSASACHNANNLTSAVPITSAHI
jgi:hypothetical protein